MPYGTYSGYTNGTNTVSTTAPMFNVSTSNATSVCRIRIYEFVSGSDATPADAGVKFSWRRTTANFGTPAAVTPNPLDSADRAALALFSAPGGTAPTITASSDLYQWAQNQRATYRWIAAPDSELVVPPTNANGLALLSAVASATANYAWTVSWKE